MPWLSCKLHSEPLSRLQVDIWKVDMYQHTQSDYHAYVHVEILQPFTFSYAIFGLGFLNTLVKYKIVYWIFFKNYYSSTCVPFLFKHTPPFTIYIYIYTPNLLSLCITRITVHAMHKYGSRVLSSRTHRCLCSRHNRSSECRAHLFPHHLELLHSKRFELLETRDERLLELRISWWGECLRS